MKGTLRAAVLAMSLFMLAACGHQAATDKGTRQVKTVYLWDADGYTDLALLRGLKAEAASYLKTNGVAVSDDPAATDAYLKITVLGAGKDEDTGKASVKARLYILDASDNSTVYDATYEAKGRGDYPVKEFVRGALKGFIGDE